MPSPRPKLTARCAKLESYSLLGLRPSRQGDRRSAASIDGAHSCLRLTAGRFAWRSRVTTAVTDRAMTGFFGVGGWFIAVPGLGLPRG